MKSGINLHAREFLWHISFPFAASLFLHFFAMYFCRRQSWRGKKYKLGTCWLLNQIWLFNKFGQPDEPFPNWKASKSVDQQILLSLETSCDGFESPKFVKGLVGNPFSRNSWVQTSEFWLVEEKNPRSWSSKVLPSRTGDHRFSILLQLSFNNFFLNSLRDDLTQHFTNFEPYNQSNHEFYTVQKWGSTDCEDLTL